MTPAMRKKKTPAGRADAPGYRFLLFVAGDEPNSSIAKTSLQKICDTYLEQNCQVEIIDILEDFQRALEERIPVTPALVIAEPGPRTVVFGNLSDTRKVLNALKVAT